MYYVISNTLQARGEFTKVNEEEMTILTKATIPTCNVTLNLGAFLLFHLDRQAVQTHGAITYGGIITLLAERLLINFNELQPLNGDLVISYKTLRAVGMLRKRRNVFYVHIPGSAFAC